MSRAIQEMKLSSLRLCQNQISFIFLLFRDQEIFQTMIGNTLVDVPGRVLKTPGILYGEVGVEPGYFLSNLCRSNRLQKLFKLIRNGEL